MSENRKPEKRTLKLFMWEKTLKDWSYGMVCVLAYDENHAWELLKKRDYVAWESMRGEHNNGILEKPKIIKRPKAFVSWGGS